MAIGTVTARPIAAMAMLTIVDLVLMSICWVWLSCGPKVGIRLYAKLNPANPISPLRIFLRLKLLAGINSGMRPRPICGRRGDGAH